MPVPFMVRSVSGSFLSILIRQLQVGFDVITYETFVISEPTKELFLNSIHFHRGKPMGDIEYLDY